MTTKSKSNKFKTQLQRSHPYRMVCDMLGFEFNECLGTGHFAVALKTGRGTVLKLTVDAQYMKYVELCEKVDNPFLPKILNNFGQICTIGQYNTPMYAVELELYKEIYDADVYYNDDQEEEYPLSELFIDLKTVMNHNKGINFHQSLCRELATHPVMQIATIYNLDLFPFLDAINLIHSEFKDKDCFFDMHRGNFMVGEAGQLVITDPVGDIVSGGYGISQPYGDSKYKDFLSGMDTEKMEKLMSHVGGDREISVFSNFKMKALSEKRLASPVIAQEWENKPKIAVRLKGITLNKWNTYSDVTKYFKKEEEAKKAREAEKASNFKLGVDFGVDGKRDLKVRIDIPVVLAPHFMEGGIREVRMLKSRKNQKKCSNIASAIFAFNLAV